jgi:hypothetical protein
MTSSTGNGCQGKIIDMKNPSRFRLLMIILIIIACVGVSLVLSNPSFLKHSAPGHVIRWIHGETGAQQTVSDLADDLRSKPLVDQMQQWSLEVMNRFDSGKIATNQNSPNWPIHAVVIAPHEVPDFVKSYRANEQPEVAVGISTNSHAECVIIDWYLYGIVIGPTNRGQTFFDLYDDLANKPIEPLHSVYVKPGVFAIWFDSK